MVYTRSFETLNQNTYHPYVYVCVCVSGCVFVCVFLQKCMGENIQGKYGCHAYGDICNAI